MSHGKHIKPNSLYLKELISLREQGYSWSAIARYFKKDHTTILYHWQKWVGKPSQTNKKLKHMEICTKPVVKPSWDGNRHICCGSFLPKKHFTGCKNVAGTWENKDNFWDLPTAPKHKYDQRFDEKKNLGKSYQQYRLK